MDFGASYSDFDNKSTVENALDYCAEKAYTMLVIESGAYYFRRNKGLKLNGVGNVLAEENSAELIFSNAVTEVCLPEILNCTKTFYYEEIGRRTTHKRKVRRIRMIVRNANCCNNNFFF